MPTCFNTFPNNSIAASFLSFQSILKICNNVNYGASIFF